MFLQFHGAARTVTGSMHLLSIGDRTILLDCGIYHGRREEARLRNSQFPFDPASIDAVVLSHAHIDHSGNLPGLVKQGFHGTIFCTKATKSLCEVMLLDSAFIQERDAEFINRKNKQQHLSPVQPLYSQEDARQTLRSLVGMDYSRTFTVTDGVECRYEDAGHILGSASVSLTLQEGNRRTNLAFTGDLGRPHLPILRDPVFIDQANEAEYLISESTYGGRLHAPVAQMSDQLLAPIRRACERKGKIIIPAFSVGRTQEIIYVLQQLSRKGQIDNLPVYVDSPLSVNVTDVFRKHTECFDPETQSLISSGNGNDPFGFERLTYIRSVEESKELNSRRGPFIVISASGMCEAGRVVHHLANSVGDARNMVLIVGYQAENTLGKKLVLHEPFVNILGERRDVRAEIVVLNSFSGHADKNELLEYIREFDRRKLRQVFLVHGDPDQAEMLTTGIRQSGFGRISIPARGEKAQLS